MAALTAEDHMGSIYPQPRAWVFPTDVFHVLQAKGKDAFFGEDVSVGVRDLWAWAPGSGCHKPTWPPGGDRCVAFSGNLVSRKRRQEPLKILSKGPRILPSIRPQYQALLVQILI